MKLNQTVAGAATANNRIESTRESKVLGVLEQRQGRDIKETERQKNWQHHTFTLLSWATFLLFFEIDCSLYTHTHIHVPFPSHVSILCADGSALQTQTQVQERGWCESCQPALGELTRDNILYLSRQFKCFTTISTNFRSFLPSPPFLQLNRFVPGCLAVYSGMLSGRKIVSRQINNRIFINTHWQLSLYTFNISPCQTVYAFM